MNAYATAVVACSVQAPARVPSHRTSDLARAFARPDRYSKPNLRPRKKARLSSDLFTWLTLVEEVITIIKTDLVY